MNNFSKITISSIFAISMAFLEASVVVYLRELYYPNGFTFPLQFMSSRVFSVEIIREAYTIIMLFSVAFIAGRNKETRFAFFILCFAIWDIFYYIFLKAIIGWPDTFYTWDILFLIPTLWAGPVIAPIIVSLTMIVFFSVLIIKNSGNKHRSFLVYEIILILIGAFVLFLSFISDYSYYILSRYSLVDLFNNLSNPKLQQLVFNYMPGIFDWTLFWIGEGLILLSMISYILKKNKKDYPRPVIRERL